MTAEQREWRGRGYDAGVAAIVRAMIDRFPDMAGDIAVAATQKVARQGRSCVTTALARTPEPVAGEAAFSLADDWIVPSSDLHGLPFLTAALRSIETAGRAVSMSAVVLRTVDADDARLLLLGAGWRVSGTDVYAKSGQSVFVLCGGDCEGDAASPLEGVMVDGFAFIEPDRLQRAMAQRVRRHR